MVPCKKITNIMLVFILFLPAAMGCVQHRKAVVVAPKPTCEEAINNELRFISDNEVVELLDEALQGDWLEDCWVPLMKLSLLQQRDVPQRHLAKAVHIFNKRRYADLFPTTVYRYFANIVKGAAEYRTTDRKLLEAYCRYLINNAKSSRDKNLSQARVICRKLDPALYSKLFE